MIDIKENHSFLEKLEQFLNMRGYIENINLSLLSSKKEGNEIIYYKDFDYKYYRFINTVEIYNDGTLNIIFGVVSNIDDNGAVELLFKNIKQKHDLYSINTKKFGVATALLKPSDVVKFIKIKRLIESYWKTVNTFARNLPKSRGVLKV